MPDQVLELYPYRYSGQGGSCWVFDDERTQLKVEALVGGSSEILDEMLKANNIYEGSEKGFTVRFSGDPFAGYEVKLRWIASDADTDYSTEAGNWYAGKVHGRVMVGWLCPALGLYFQEKAPDELYIRVELLRPGINPIWDNTAQAQQFVAPPGSDEDLAS